MSSLTEVKSLAKLVLRPICAKYEFNIYILNESLRLSLKILTILRRMNNL